MEYGSYQMDNGLWSKPYIIWATLKIAVIPENFGPSQIASKCNITQNVRQISYDICFISK